MQHQTRSSSSPADLATRDQPLGLTVHAMPELDPTTVAQVPDTRAGRLKMLAVLLVCAAPVIASYLTYYVIRPEGRRNYGELINPQRSLPPWDALAGDGKRVGMDRLKGQWLLVSVAGGACNAMCQQQLYLQRQLRESLGREKDRLDWVWLVSDEAPIPGELKAALLEATVLRVPNLDQWLQATPGQRLPDHLYLVDPLGNWMMRFPAASMAPTLDTNASSLRPEGIHLPRNSPAVGVDAAHAAKIKRDLERVLRASSAWDKAGR